MYHFRIKTKIKRIISFKDKADYPLHRIYYYCLDINKLLQNISAKLLKKNRTTFENNAMILK